MSVASWQAEYYPIPAIEAAVDDITATHHCRVKWSGLSKEVLAEHDLVKEEETNHITDRWGNKFTVTNGECALCHRYDMNINQGFSCNNCPIVKSGGDHCNMRTSAYIYWVDRDDVGPMLATLDAALEWCQGQEKVQQ